MRLFPAASPPSLLATLHRLLATSFRIPRKQQDLPFPLVIPLNMVMRDVFAQRSPQRALTKKNRLGQELLLHRSHPALRIAIQVRTVGRQRHGG